MYKLSKFNYSCKNKNGDLLLFNTYEGPKSTCKIKDSSIQNKLLSGDLSFGNNRLIERLLEKGILVRNETDEDLKLNNLIYRIISQSDLLLTICPTEQCNFRCKYCYESHNNYIMSDKVKNDLLLYIKHNIYKYTRLQVNWFGGEPLLALDQVKDISEELIKICRFYRRRYFSTMTTNGYLLDIETFKNLLDYQILSYQITIDGTKSMHDNQRPTVNGDPTFDTIISNLEKIKSMKNKNFRIVIRSNITYEIFKNLDEYIDLITYFCSNDKRFSVLINYACVWSENIGEDFKRTFLFDRDSILPIYQKIIKESKKVNLVFLLSPESGSCQLGVNNRFFIRPNGEIHKCSVHFENPANIVGELFNGEIELNDTYLTKLINPNMCPNLHNCFFAPICKGETCPAGRKSRSVCPETKQHLSYILQLMDNYEPFEIIDS